MRLPIRLLALATLLATTAVPAQDRELSEQGFMNLLAEQDLSKGETALKSIEERLLKYCNQLRLPERKPAFVVHDVRIAQAFVDMIRIVHLPASLYWPSCDINTCATLRGTHW